MGVGRKALPTATKQLRGNPGKRALNHAEPTPPPGAPVQPSWLDKAERKEWDRLVPILQEMKVLSKADGEMLAGFCTAIVSLQRAKRLVSKAGIVAKTPQGIKTHPGVTARNAALKEMRAYAALFGLDPSSRSRLKIGEEAPEDPLRALMSKKPN